MVETLPKEKALCFYPNGLPAAFGERTELLSTDWASERVTQMGRSVDSYLEQNAEFWDNRRQRIDNQFYSGAHMAMKPFHTAVSEYTYRSVTYITGRPYVESQNNQGKIVNRELRVQDASLLPESEQYEPLYPLPSV